MSNPDKDLETQGQEHVVKGKIQQTVGSLERKAGKALGDKKMEGHGLVRELNGKTQAAGGEVQQAADQNLNQEA